MTTRREVHQAKIDQLITVIERDLGEPVNGGNFEIWATRTFLQSVNDPPTADELEDRVLDGADDLGLDLYFVDEEAEIVYLFQSKYRRNDRTIQRQEMDSFLNSPERLMPKDSLKDNSNFALLEFAQEFRKLVRRGFEIALVYVTTERPTPQIERTISDFNSGSLTLPDVGHVTHYAAIFGLDDLLSASIASAKPTDTELELEDWFEGSDPNGANRFLSGKVSASELIRIFGVHRHQMFRLNPRGPLGVVKVNREIKHSLESDIDRDRFYFLNNGLTAVCESFKRIDGQSGKIDVRDFQIVNGCQTTWTLYEHQLRGGPLEGVALSIKLIEAAPSDILSTQISQASNSQSPMKDWDFLFAEKQQMDLQRDFERLEEPLFYELKRGEQRFIRGVSGKKTTIKDVAQAMWAFVGYPGEARDRLRDIPRLYKLEGSAYQRVFFEGVTSRHLWLPYEVHERVKNSYKESPPSVAPEAGQVNRRLHLVWLIGELLLKAIDIPAFEQIDSGSLTRVSRRVDDWFPKAYAHANVAINATVQQHKDREGNLTVSLRQLFRSPQYYDHYRGSLEDVSAIHGFDDLRSAIVGD